MVSYKTKHIIFIRSSHHTPWHCPKGVKNTSIQTCTQMLIETLFIIAKTWKKPAYPLVGKWINELWYIQTMKYSLTVKRKELSSHGKTWRNPKCMLWSKRNLFEKAIYYNVPTIWHFRKGITIGTVKRLVIAKVKGERDGQAEHGGFLGEWKYSWPLNNRALNYMGTFIHRFFYKYSTVL